MLQVAHSTAETALQGIAGSQWFRSQGSKPIQCSDHWCMMQVTEATGQIAEAGPAASADTANLVLAGLAGASVGIVLIAKQTQDKGPSGAGKDSSASSKAPTASSNGAAAAPQTAGALPNSLPLPASYLWMLVSFACSFNFVQEA